MKPGKSLLRTFIVQVFRETELLEWACWSCKDSLFLYLPLEGCGCPKRIDFCFRRSGIYIYIYIERERERETETERETEREH